MHETDEDYWMREFARDMPVVEWKPIDPKVLEAHYADTGEFRLKHAKDGI